MLVFPNANPVARPALTVATDELPLDQIAEEVMLPLAPLE
jgi:hypothetical protein